MNHYLLLILFIAIIIVMIFSIESYIQWHKELSIMKFKEKFTCDELYLEETVSKSLKTATYEKCMSDIFPEGYPDRVDLQQYFLKQTCETLGVHILKKHFEYEMATEIYNVKCSTPIDRLELPEIVIERSEKQISNSEETWTKSDESNYGKQYKDEN